jgi:tetratricopeptide (TPR) repeat protein
MLSRLIQKKILSPEEIKSEKKRITGSPSPDLFYLTLIQNDFNAADQISSALKKHKIHRESPELCLAKVFNLTETRNFEEAETLLNSVSLTPKYSEYITILRINLEMSQEKYREVLNFIQSLPAQTSFSTLKSLQANLYLKDSEAVFALISENKEKFPELLPIFSLSKAILKEKFEKALKILETFPKSQENLQDIHLFHAFIQAKLKNFESALSSLHETLEINNKNEQAWHLAFIVFFELRNLTDSFYCLNKCLQFNERPAYYAAFSKLYETGGKPHLAKAFFAKARKIDLNFQLNQQIDFPILDFSEFGKRKNQFVPKPVVACTIFVKPEAKKVNLKKTKKSNFNKNEFEPAHVLGSMSSSFMFKGTKKNGFKVLPS